MKIFDNIDNVNLSSMNREMNISKFCRTTKHYSWENNSFASFKYVLREISLALRYVPKITSTQ